MASDSAESAQSGPAEDPLAQEGDAGRDTEAPMTGAPAETLDNYIEPENEENFLDMLNRCASVSAPISQAPSYVGPVSPFASVYCRDDAG